MTSEDIKHQLIITTSIPPPPPPPFSPSLISLMVSVDVKHHVYLHLHTPPPPPFSPSLISLMVSMDVKHHVYLHLHTPSPLPPTFSPSLISLMVLWTLSTMFTYFGMTVTTHRGQRMPHPQGQVCALHNNTVLFHEEYCSPAIHRRHVQELRLCPRPFSTPNTSAPQRTINS